MKGGTGPQRPVRAPLPKPASLSLEQLGISPEFHPFISHLSVLARGRERMPFIGREKELEALMETLLRKLKKDIILVGKPGVGKTALITELADRINRGRVPASLRGKVILELSLNQFFYSRESIDLLAKDFEKLFSEIRRNRERVILFLDEMQRPIAGRRTAAGPRRPAPGVAESPYRQPGIADHRRGHARGLL